MSLQACLHMLVIDPAAGEGPRSFVESGRESTPVCCPGRKFGPSDAAVQLVVLHSAPVQMLAEHKYTLL